MSSKKITTPPHQLQDQPAEGDRELIDRELSRKGKDRSAPELPDIPPAGPHAREEPNPNATPGSGMLPSTDDDDPNMAPTG
jgi:hypothetical protein